jgi:hypothetical protein
VIFGPGFVVVSARVGLVAEAGLCPFGGFLGSGFRFLPRGVAVAVLDGGLVMRLVG